MGLKIKKVPKYMQPIQRLYFIDRLLEPYFRGSKSKIITAVIKAIKPMKILRLTFHEEKLSLKIAAIRGSSKGLQVKYIWCRKWNMDKQFQQ